MDSRRLRELRDVYVRLSHQSTGAMVGVGGSGAGKGGGGTGAEPDSGSKGATGLQASDNRDRSNPDPAAATPAVAPAAGGSTNTAGSSAANAATSGTLDPFNSEVQGTGQATTAAVADCTAERREGQRAAAPLSGGSAVTACGNGSDYAGARRRRGAGLRSVDQFAHHPVPLGLRERSTSDSGSVRASGMGSAPKRRRKGKQEGDKFYPRSYFEWNDDLMEHQVPEQSWVSFVTSIFELGLKHSSPKVLMKLMPPKADRLTTEHIKSRLQKYRLHAERSKEEFLEFFNLRLQAKFKDFVDKEGWRNLSPRHGTDNDHDVDCDTAADNAGGEVPGMAGGGGGVGGGDGTGGVGGSDSEEPLAVNVDGRMVGDILDLGAQCVREQANLQDVLRHHIAAQLKLQAEIHEHLTTSTTAATAAAPPHPPPLCTTLSTASSMAAESEAGSNCQHGDEALLGSRGDSAQTNEGGGHGGPAGDDVPR